MGLRLMNVVAANSIDRDPTARTDADLIYSKVRIPKQAIRFRLYCLLVLLDAVALCVAFPAANEFRFGRFLAAPGFHLLVMTLPLYLVLAVSRNCYTSLVFTNWRASVVRALVALAATALTILFISFYLQASVLLSRSVFSFAACLTGLLLSINRRVIHAAAGYLFDGPAIDQLVIQDEHRLPFRPYGAEVIDLADYDLKPDTKDPLMLDAWGQFFRGRDRVIVACPPSRRQAWSVLLKGANVEGEILIPEIADLGSFGARTFEGESTLLVSAGVLNLKSRLMKRSFDLIVTISAITFLMPVFLITAIAIKFESRGPVLFVQPRLGRSNRLFSVYKFRSMRSDLCDVAGNQSASRTDQRITKVGGFIRANSIDELPQLFNVLRGEMSIVGPRPHALGSLAGEKLFWEVDDRYWRRHAAKPGLTGLAQVRGFRGATHEQSDLVSRLQADLDYINNWSIWRDIGIILSTIKVLRHSNAF